MSRTPLIPPHLGDVARLLSDPHRLRMLWALGDGRAYTARELAQLANLSPSAASNHLTQLVSAGLVEVRAQGRHRYFTVTREDVGRAVEALAAVSLTALPATSPPRPQPGAALRHARRCYGHLAGSCGVALWDTLLAAGLIDAHEGGHRVTPKGVRVFESLGLSAAGPAQPCLDWTERRWHLGGTLGRAVLGALQRDGVLAPSPSGDRVLLVDPHRWQALLQRVLTDPPSL